jgi:hypothetical protein
LVHGSFSDRDVGRGDLNNWSVAVMPFKHNSACRHRIDKMKFGVTNWPEYEAGLRRRGSLTRWLTPEALSGWQAPRRKTRGGRQRYSDLAIETTLTLGLVFGLRLRQIEGLLGSLQRLMNLDLAVPNHMPRRAVDCFLRSARPEVVSCLD